MNYLSLNDYLKNTFGCKVYKLAIDAGFTCPNRDGTLSKRGCLFCSGMGSGDFASSRNLSIYDQIESAKERVQKKIKDGKYIAYFQAFTNTYAPVDILREKFSEAINHPDIVAISIGTRPDCLADDILDLLTELNKIKPVWVELGLQTIHEETSQLIRRGYALPVYDTALVNLKHRGIYVITHVILGLPGETEEMMLDTVRYVCGKSAGTNNNSLDLSTDGIKLQLLHIIKGTDLAKLYEYYCINDEVNSFSSENINDVECDSSTVPNGYDNTDEDFDYLSYKNVMKDFKCLELDEYTSLIKKCLEIIPNNIAIHRLTGDGDKKTLLAPLYSGDKKRVLNAINKALS